MDLFHKTVVVILNDDALVLGKTKKTDWFFQSVFKFLKKKIAFFLTIFDQVMYGTID